MAEMTVSLLSRSQGQVQITRVTGHLTTRISGESTLNPKLAQMMVHVEVGVSHPLGPRHPTQCCVRKELALRTTEAIKKNAKILQIGRELGR